MPTCIEVQLAELKCPMPIVQLSKLMKTLRGGDEVIAIAADRAFFPDVEAWCKRTGHKLLASSVVKGTCRARIQKVGI